MTLAAPEWLTALIAVPLLAVAGWLTWRRRSKRWHRLVAPRLRPRLARERPPWVHFTTLALLLAGWSGLIIAMAQPESGEEWVEVENEGRNILFCIDISRSMLAEDAPPSRLAAARSAALTILEKFPNDRIGVLLFAGESLVQSPLTIDHSYVEQTLAQLDPGDIPYGGSDLTAAIGAGTNLLTDTGQKSNIMVVFSDGEKSSEGLTGAAEKAAEAGVFIYALGMGTTEGTHIPDPRERDGRFKDRRGNVVHTQLDESALETLARETGGYYSQGMGGDFLGKLDTALAEMDRFREEGKYQRVAKPAHQWFAALGIFLLMSSLFVRCLPLRPLVSLVALVTSGLTALPAEAGAIEDGIAALQNGAPAEAHLAFRKAAGESRGARAAQLHLSAGSAAARAGNWEGAVESFSEALANGDAGIQQQASYGLGTSLFYLGLSLPKEEKIKAWEGSVAHFEAALKLLPDDQAARDNLATVNEELRKLTEQEPEPETPEEDPPSEKETEEEEENQEQTKEEAQSEAPEPQDDEQDTKKSGEEEDQKEQEQPSPNKSDDQEQKKEQEDGRGERENEPSEKRGDEDEASDNPSDGEAQKQNDSPDQAEGKLEEDADAPENETPEERARRLLRQYADFGAKAPRRTRRPFNRADQDW